MKKIFEIIPPQKWASVFALFIHKWFVCNLQFTTLHGFESSSNFTLTHHGMFTCLVCEYNLHFLDGLHWLKTTLIYSNKLHNFATFHIASHLILHLSCITKSIATSQHISCSHCKKNLFENLHYNLTIHCNIILL